MPFRPCLVCGKLGPASYCARHRPARERLDPERGSGGKAATFRRRTLALTGGRCVVVGCRTSFDRVQAHHVHALADGGDPEGRGLPLCSTHHRLATERERELRSAYGHADQVPR